MFHDQTLPGSQHNCRTMSLISSGIKRRATRVRSGQVSALTTRLVGWLIVPHCSTIRHGSFDRVSACYLGRQRCGTLTDNDRVVATEWTESIEGMTP